MVSVFRKDRCAKCYEERATRNCLRHDKNIGWECCNGSRSDLKCPPQCQYAPKVTDDVPFPAVKSDSRSEFQHFSKLYIDFWLNKHNPAFDGASPISIARENPERMLHWLSSFKYPSGFPLKYLMDRLSLKNDIPEIDTKDPEEQVIGYLNEVLKREWKNLRGFTINKLEFNGFVERYAELIAEIPQLRKLNDYKIVSAGISEDGGTAFVLVELNHRQLWTLILTPRDGSWKIRQNIKGSPEIFYEQNKRANDIAELLSKGDEAQAWHLLEEARILYPDSADIYYYYGLHSQLVKQFDRAKVQFFSALVLDNEWSVPYYHLAALYLNEDNYEEALYWNEALSGLLPDDPNALNNVAACYAGLKNYAKAREIWEGLCKRFPDFELARMNLQKLNDGV